MPENLDYKIYIIQHNKRTDGCDFSLADSPPICPTQDVVAILRAKKPAFGGLNVAPGVIGQLDVMLGILKQQFPEIEFVGGQEQQLLLEFAVQMVVKQRMGKNLYLATINNGELEESFLPFCTA